MTEFTANGSEADPVVIGKLHQLFLCNLGDAEWDNTARSRLCEILGERFESFTLQDAAGYFRSKLAQTVIITVGTDDTASVIAVGHKLRCEFDQEGVGLAFDGFYQRLLA